MWFWSIEQCSQSQAFIFSTRTDPYKQQSRGKCKKINWFSQINFIKWGVQCSVCTEWTVSVIRRHSLLTVCNFIHNLKKICIYNKHFILLQQCLLSLAQIFNLDMFVFIRCVYMTVNDMKISEKTFLHTVTAGDLFLQGVPGARIENHCSEWMNEDYHQWISLSVHPPGGAQICCLIGDTR